MIISICLFTCTWQVCIFVSVFSHTRLNQLSDSCPPNHAGNIIQIRASTISFVCSDLQGTWFKKAHCLLLLDKLYNLWCDCVLKLDPGDKDRPGALLFYYEKNSVYEEVLIPFVEITCVSIFHKMSRNHCFAVHTPLKTVAKNPLVICTGSEKDLNDWVTSIANAAAQVHKSEGPASSRAIWAVSTRGDVFFSEPPPEDVPLRPNQLYWRQVGGHMKHVEAGCAGVVWGIGYDGVPYAYTGGYGGGIFTGFASSSHGIYQQEDFDTYVIYENQRWNPIEGFSDRYCYNVDDHRIPKVANFITFGFSSTWMTLLSGCRYLWRVVTFGYQHFVVDVKSEHGSPKRFRKT